MQSGVQHPAEEGLDAVLGSYETAFLRKRFPVQRFERDGLMDVFGLDGDAMSENRQYWFCQLGRVWEKLIREIWMKSGVEAEFPKPGDPRRPCDVISGKWAIDAKYRLGSGDSGTLQKLASNGRRLARGGYSPILLVFREDSLSSSLAAMRRSGWSVLEGEGAFAFLRETLGFDVPSYLASRRGMRASWRDGSG